MDSHTEAETKLENPSGNIEGSEPGAKAAAQTKLDPCAKEWDPMMERAPEEARCLFLTFSNGYPLTEQQIVRFFNCKYGTCVERVYVHLPENKKKQAAALFGKVVFNASYIPALVLGGGAESRFVVDGKPLWCKKFEPNKKMRAPSSRWAQYP